MSPDEPGSSWLLMEILVEVFWTKRSSEQEQIWDKRSKLQKPSPRSIIVVTFTFPSRPENVLHCPPLSEGEGLACRVLQVNPFIIHIIMFYTCVFVFDLIMCNVYCMYSYLILHLPILQLYIYTFIFFMYSCLHLFPWRSCENVAPSVDPGQVSGSGAPRGAALLTHRRGEVAGVSAINIIIISDHHHH